MLLGRLDIGFGIYCATSACSTSLLNVQYIFLLGHPILYMVILTSTFMILVSFLIILVSLLMRQVMLHVNELLQSIDDDPLFKNKSKIIIFINGNLVQQNFLEIFHGLCRTSDWKMAKTFHISMACVLTYGVYIEVRFIVK